MANIQVIQYFKSLEKDRLDKGTYSRKIEKLAVFRQKMLQLPDSVFDTTIDQLSSIVNANLSEYQKLTNPGLNESARKNLFPQYDNETIITSSGASDKISAI